MIEVFADPVLVTQDFYRTLGNGSAVIAMGVLLVWWLDRGRPTSLSLGLLTFIGGGIVLVFSVIDYYQTAGRFTSLRIDAGELTLSYPEPFGGTVRVPTAQVRDTLWGVVGKRPEKAVACYITFELRDGKTHRSATRSESLESCKALRASIAQALARN